MGTAGKAAGCVKLSTHLHLVPRLKNAWRYNSTPPHVVRAWCLVKHRDKLTKSIQNEQQESSTFGFRCKCTVAKLFTLSRARNYFVLYIVKYLRHRKMFEINVVNFNGIRILCYVQFLVRWTIFEEINKIQFELHVTWWMFCNQH
jgi:hypothetical protein